MKFVSDSSPLIFLSKLDTLDLLQHHQIFIPTSVRNELLVKKSLECDRLKQFFTRKNVKIVEVKRKRQFSNALGRGEMEVINCALERKIPNVLIDDRRARSLSRIHGLHTKGTIWVIFSAYKRKNISKKELKRLIFELPAHGFRIDEVFLMRVLKEIE